MTAFGCRDCGYHFSGPIEECPQCGALSPFLRNVTVDREKAHAARQRVRNAVKRLEQAKAGLSDLDAARADLAEASYEVFAYYSLVIRRTVLPGRPETIIRVPDDQEALTDGESIIFVDHI